MSPTAPPRRDVVAAAHQGPRLGERFHELRLEVCHSSGVMGGFMSNGPPPTRRGRPVSGMLNLPTAKS
jgi:hypothetical protein